MEVLYIFHWISKQNQGTVYFMEYLLMAIITILIGWNAGLTVAYLKEKERKTRVVKEIVTVKESVDVAEMTDGYVAMAKAIGEAIHGQTLAPAPRPEGFSMGDVGLDNEAGVRPGRWFPSIEFDESMDGNIPHEEWNASDGLTVQPTTVGEI